MSYVIAFEDDTSARDVTRRYASQYNAKTRKVRVESTKGGEKWWRQTIKFFDRPLPETRDEIEDNEMVAREAQEGMPKSVADFKGHPIFALERHLKRNEVIYPLREAGKISAGAGAKVEPVYRRKDVHVVRSADQWYRKGRDVKEGEQPLKWANTQRSKRSTPIGEDEVSEDGTGLYAEFQTDVYVPPPAVDGKIPRNAYGNLDVYVPSMIPAGAILLQHPIAARAAKALGVDYADAVTGFDFKRRQGTAVVNGIVAGEEYREGLVEVIRGMEQEQAEAEQEKRTKMALQMWRRFMTALRIRNKIDKEYADTGSDEDMTDQTYDETGSGNDGVGGGFTADAHTNEPDISLFTAQPGLMTASLPFLPSEITVIESPHKLEKPALEAISPKVARFESLFDDAEVHRNGGGFLAEGAGEEEGGGFMPEADANDEGGGFIPEEADDDQGGRLVSGEPTDEPNVTLPERLDAGLGFRSGSGAAPLEEGDKSPPQRPPLAAATRGLPVAALSLPTEAVASNGKTLLETLEKPPALLNETSVPSGNEIESRRSPDSIDNESLLSHDPEDEDAEPEWLVDDEEL
jgi:xeroderma pigmentosum group C-complementing protein